MNTVQAQTIITELLTHLGVSVTSVDVNSSGFEPRFVVRTPDSGILIGKNGEHLRAFNAIVRRIFEKRFALTRETPCLVDVNGYYSRRLKELRQQATLLADRARLFKTDVAMNPMNPYERMIHSFFTNDPDLSTQSEGEGRERHIVIRYRQAQRTETSLSDNALFNQ
jgi:spoIIIJ-associated protein